MKLQVILELECLPTVPTNEVRVGMNFKMILQVSLCVKPLVTLITYIGFQPGVLNKSNEGCNQLQQFSTLLNSCYLIPMIYELLQGYKTLSTFFANKFFSCVDSHIRLFL